MIDVIIYMALNYCSTNGCQRVKLEASFSLTNINDCESYPVAIIKIDYMWVSGSKKCVNNSYKISAKR